MSRLYPPWCIRCQKRRAECSSLQPSPQFVWSIRHTHTMHSNLCFLLGSWTQQKSSDGKNAKLAASQNIPPEKHLASSQGFSLTWAGWIFRLVPQELSFPQNTSKYIHVYIYQFPKTHGKWWSNFVFPMPFLIWSYFFTSMIRAIARWDVETTQLRLTLYDKSVGTGQTIGDRGLGLCSNDFKWLRSKPQVNKIALT